MVWQTGGVFYWVVIGLSLLFIYARFVEPQKIIVRREKLVLGKTGRKIKLILATDLHLGMFKGEKFLKKVLQKIADLGSGDLILLGGDLINDPSRQQFKSMFEPLKTFKHRTFAITGNHDAGVPGDYSSEQVGEAMEKVGVGVIDNRIVTENVAGQKIKIVGLSDLMEGKVDWAILGKLTSETVNIVLAHNPDAAYLIPRESNVDLIVSGHTHGGQIKLPPLSNWLIPCKYPFVRGWYEVKGRPVFVSSGLGEVVLPLRFLIPPEVVILEVFL